MIDENFLTKNIINTSKVTYSYKFPYEIISKYNYKEPISNKARNNFLSSLFDRLSKSDDEKLILNRPHYKIELNYAYNNKYYNINISNERIVFNNIDFEDTHGLEIIIFDLIGFQWIEMGKCKYHNTIYKIDFGSCYINTMIETFNDFVLDEGINTKKQTESKHRVINVYEIKHGYKKTVKYKISLKGRNVWLINQNMNLGSIEDFTRFYKYIKSVVILPSLLKYLQKDECSLFNYLPLEIIDIIIDMLYIIGNKEKNPPKVELFKFPINVRMLLQPFIYNRNKNYYISYNENL